MKIALYLPNHLGDAVVTSSIIGWIKKEHSRVSVILIGRKPLEGLFKDFPGSDLFIPVNKSLHGFFGAVFSLKRESPDQCFILPKSFSSALLVFLAGIKTRVGYDTDFRSFLLTEKYRLKDHKKEHFRYNYFRLFKSLLSSPPPDMISFGISKPTKKTARFFKDLKGFVAIDPGAAYGKTKMWEDQKWLELIEKINKTKKVVLIGVRNLSGWENICHGVVNLSSKTDLEDLPYILSRASVLISGDTGSMHLASSLGVSTISLFGSSSPIWTSPWGGGRSVVIYKDLPCSPCFEKKCPKKDIECMKAISVDEVYKAVMDLVILEVSV
ncbi:glycosyltransferase family 9 protein [candidate division WOR-3 bacterium]|nr:glycosyltransferase family 9 protein [candidate division WOR-3 bacterium]